jgi:hypothetical protein
LSPRVFLRATEQVDACSYGPSFRRRTWPGRARRLQGDLEIPALHSGRKKSSGIPLNPFFQKIVCQSGFELQPIEQPRQEVILNSELSSFVRPGRMGGASSDSPVASSSFPVLVACHQLEMLLRVHVKIRFEPRNDIAEIDEGSRFDPPSPQREILGGFLGDI